MRITTILFLLLSFYSVSQAKGTDLPSDRNGRVKTVDMNCDEIQDLVMEEEAISYYDYILGTEKTVYAHREDAECSENKAPLSHYIITKDHLLCKIGYRCSRFGRK